MNLLKKLDKLLINFSGLQDAVIPDNVGISSTKIKIYSTELGSRFVREDSLSSFSKKINKVSPSDKKKLGQALGSALAKDLSISFEEFVILPSDKASSL